MKKRTGQLTVIITMGEGPTAKVSQFETSLPLSRPEWDGLKAVLEEKLTVKSRAKRTPKLERL